MQTVFSETGIEVRFSCTIHLLNNGEIIECEYKSDNTGRDLLQYVCKHQNLQTLDYWGLKFVSGGVDERRYWLEMDKLIQSQVKNVSGPIRFHFRVKVYPLEPYKINDCTVRCQVFQQLRLDLLSGRLTCSVNDAAMLVALILQFVFGEFNRNLFYNYMNYIKEKIIRKERFQTQYFLSIQARALEIYESYLSGLERLEIQDLFLRMASKLNTYGVEPFLVENIQKIMMDLWINYTGIVAIMQKRRVLDLHWSEIVDISRKDESLLIYIHNKKLVILKCASISECNYVWNIAVSNLAHFNSFIATIPQNMFAENDDKRNTDGESNATALVDYKCKKLDPNYKCFNASLTNALRLSDCSLCKRVNFKWLMSQAPIYLFLVMYVLGYNTQLFTELLGKWNLQHPVGNFLLNKMMMS